MNIPARNMLLAVSLFGILDILACAPGWAQVLPGSVPGAGNIATGRRSQGPAGGAEKPPVPAPDAIPGAKAREPAAPATRAAGDMQPNEALFDAINRGDIAAARDALNRGADLNGENVLGMTPMELSVDLGRNDISFLLLSMRGEDSGRGSRALGRDNPAPAQAQKTAQANAAQVKKPTAPVRSVLAKVTKPGVATPKLFANDGGTPLPSAGFLGFGTHQATN
jgi:hypothetical protein